MISCGECFAGPHVRVRHARHRHVRERFATAVARGLHAHEARVQLVLQIADEHAVLDERRALRRRAFVIDVQ